MYKLYLAITFTISLISAVVACIHAARATRIRAQTEASVKLIRAELSAELDPTKQSRSENKKDVNRPEISLTSLNGSGTSTPT